jgi:gas vesicle protein
MNYQDDTARKNKNGGIVSALGAAAVGVAVGAAAAYLSDKHKREALLEKAGKTTETVKNKANDVLTTAADKTGDALQEAGKKVKGSKSKTDEVFDDIISATDDMGNI